MVPHHFWWLLETLAGADTKSGAYVTDDEKAELLGLIDKFNRGEM